MRIIIEKMFKNEIEYIIYDENLLMKVNELERNILKFKEKLFQNKFIKNETSSVDEHVSIEK